MQQYREEENNMKKRILTAVLAAALVTGTCAATVSAKEEKTYTIGICQLVQHDALDAATKGFEDAITEKMGDSVKFDEQNAQGDSNTCSTIINSFVSEGADLILANATASLQAAAAGTSDTRKCLPGTGGGEPGDLLLKVTVGTRPGYERKGSDVYTTISIPYTTAVFGGEATVPTLYGNVICKIREGMQSGSKIRLRGKGIVSMKNPSVRGDQYVTIQIQVPQNLNYSAKEKLHEYAKACGLERSNATGSHVA